MTTMDLRPQPGAALTRRMWAAQTKLELDLLLRNGEQLLLTIIIPLLLLVGLSTLDVFGARSVNDVVPGVIAVAVLSTAFTSTAIATGFDRRSGVLKFLGSTPLPRSSLVAAKVSAVLVVEALQIALLTLSGLALGWQPAGSMFAALALIALGTAALGSLGVALAGVLRAEATLAVANGLFLVLLIAGGTVVAADRLPEPLATIAGLLPSGALGNGLRAVLLDGAGLPLANIAVLAVWTAVGTVWTVRTFRWE